MRIALAFLLLPTLAFAGSSVTVQTGPPDDQVSSLVAAEKAFAQKALDTNIRDAFFDAMDNDAVLFRPTPVNAKQFFAGRPANPGPVLTWYPSYAELSGSGDLGWTTGPWEFRSAKDKQPEAWGHFATIWRRQTNGKYKVMFDEGHSCAKPPQDTLTWARLSGTQKPGEFVELRALSESQSALLKADAAYSQALVAEGMAAALAKFADDDVRVLRDDRPQFQGIEAAGKALEGEWKSGVTQWDIRAGGMSQTIDLGYTYGVATMGKGAKDSPNGRKVFRVWRRKPGDDWKLALDVTNPVPAPPPAPKATETAKNP